MVQCCTIASMVAIEIEATLRYLVVSLDIVPELLESFGNAAEM
jgi:uncharacterized membrane protein YkvA (DUF1232 family)